MYQFILLHSCDDLKNFSIKINVVADEDNSRNESSNWTAGQIGVAVQCWLSVRVELMAWILTHLQHLNGIQWLLVQVPLKQTFYSFFSGEYHMYQFIPLHSCDFFKKIWIKINVAADEDNSRNESWYWKLMKLEWLHKAGSQYQLTNRLIAHWDRTPERNSVFIGSNSTQANFV